MQLSSDDGYAADVLFDVLLSEQNYIYDSYGNETIYAGFGDDVISVISGGSDTVFAGEGIDRVSFGREESRFELANLDLENNFVELFDPINDDNIKLFDVEQLTFTDTGTKTLKEFLLPYAPPNEPTGEVIVEGEKAVGAILKANAASVADVDGLGAFSYQWRVAGETLEGITSQYYVVQKEDLGKEITVDVSYTDQWFNDEIISSQPVKITSEKLVSDDPQVIPLDDFGQITGNITGGMMSADGTYVLLSQFGDGDNQLYRKNIETGEKQIVSSTKNGTPATGDSIQAIDLSGDGRYVLFTLDEYGDVKLDPNAPANQQQQTGPLYRKDMDTGDIVRVDTLSGGKYVTPMWGWRSGYIS